MDRALCKQRKKKLFCGLIYCGVSDLYEQRRCWGCSEQKREKDSEREEIRCERKTANGKEKSVQIFTVMSCGTAAPANRNEFIAAERAFSICFGKHVGSIAIPCAPLLHKTQSDPCCTVGFV